MQLWERLQEEMLQREEAENTLQSFRQNVDLEHKVESLQEERAFLQKLHDDGNPGAAGPDSGTAHPRLTSQLPYVTYISSMENNNALHPKKQELNKYCRQVQSLTCEMAVFKGSNMSLERKTCAMKENLAIKAANYQDTIGCLQDEMQNMKE
uniref:Uncharacterized protein n=1 Tax=Molossus molossus TaxID=27622 RepID=A0A7J8J6L0_MOLMO|nr:hypothetical protein HJG59_009687 [Molossus molossus]